MSTWYESQTVESQTIKYNWMRSTSPERLEQCKQFRDMAINRVKRKQYAKEYIEQFKKDNVHIFPELHMFPELKVMPQLKNDGGTSDPGVSSLFLPYYNFDLLNKHPFGLLMILIVLIFGMFLSFLIYTS